MAEIVFACASANNFYKIHWNYFSSMKISANFSSNAGNPPTRLNPLNPSNFQIPKKPTSWRANRSGKKRFQLLREFLHGARCNYTVAHRGLCPRDSLPPEKLFPLGVGRFAAASPHSRRIILGQRR